MHLRLKRPVRQAVAAASKCPVRSLLCGLTRCHLDGVLYHAEEC